MSERGFPADGAVDDVRGLEEYRGVPVSTLNGGANGELGSAGHVRSAPPLAP